MFKDILKNIKENKYAIIYTVLLLVMCVISMIHHGNNKINNNENYAQMTTFAMDTIISFNIELVSDDEIIVDEDIFIDVERIIREYENIFSVTIKNSDIYKLNNSDFLEEVYVSDETINILNISKEFSDLTNGDFSVAIAPLVTLWGFTQDVEQKVPDFEEIAKTKQLINWEDIVINQENNTVQFLKEGMAIDLGGIAKGYAAEKVTDFLRDNGVLNGNFSLGGNVSAMGTKADNSKWKIAVKNPIDDTDYVGLLEVSDAFVVTSGGYQRYFTEDDVDYHHIIDAKTGYPSDSDLISVTIISENGTQADALSTALFVMGLDKSLEFWENNNDFEAIFITENEVIATSGISEFFEFEGRDNDFQYRIYE